MTKQELLQITGGSIKWSNSLLGYIYKTANTIMEIGRSLGSAIRRSIGGALCPL